MDHLLSLKVFIAVAEERSFAAVAKQMSMSRAMISKHVQAVEADLGARLLNRSSRQVSLTEAGETYLDRVQPLIEGLSEAKSIVSSVTHNPSGTLRVSIPVWMANTTFLNIIATFRKEYPEVKLDFRLSGFNANFVQEQIDLALRVAFTLDETLIARKLTNIKFVMVASPDLITEIGSPQKLDDLEGAPLLAYSRAITNGKILLRNDLPEIKVNAVMLSDNDVMLYHAALNGLGIAILPEMLIKDDLKQGNLIPLLQSIEIKTGPLYAVYPERKYLPAKVRCFLDFLVGPQGLSSKP